MMFYAFASRNKNDKDRIEQRRGTLIPGQGGYFDNNGYNYEIMKGDDENGDVRYDCLLRSNYAVFSSNGLIFYC